jgi:phosphomevalonate kinase
VKVVASAPGKIVVSGEYAVLVGAPALVLAVDRRVVCTLRDSAAGGWDFATHGFAPDVRHTLESLTAGPDLARSDPAFLCQHVVRQLGLVGIGVDQLPAHVHVDIDSRAGFDGGKKLGIGTSAAVCCALTGALLTRVGADHDVLPIALAAHRRAQGGRGSGLDVAASCEGGLIRFEAGQPPTVTRVAFPPVSRAAIWTGASADTSQHVSHFDAWRAGTIPAELRTLMAEASRVADAVSDKGVRAPSAAEGALTPLSFMRQLRAYTAALRALDDAAHLGIYSAAHRLLGELAENHGVVYKPCGAGGGDIGMAFAIDARALDPFERAALAAGFERLPLELDEHGITVGIEG